MSTTDRLTPEATPAAAAAGDPGSAREALEERVALDGRGLRAHTTRGVVVNSAFSVGFALIGLVQRVVVAAFLTATEFGLWGVLLTIVITLAWLKQVGISDKYIQQDDADQELAFQKAFTLELAYTAIFYVFLLGALPIFALAYGRWDIVLPAFVLSLVLPIGAFTAPIWVTYRQMRFVRQRVLEGINPILSGIVTIGLAVAGVGYWSLIWGALAGALAGAIVAMATSPYPLKLRFDRATLRSYFGFSWPLLASGAASLAVVQGTLLVGTYTVGLAGVGAIALATSFTVFADKVDAIIMRTLYPAICGVKDRTDLLFETFTKSNRLALIWGLPFGVGVFLFASDLVDVLGEQWRPAEGLLQGFGLIVAFRQIAFNWAGFLTATGNTKPLAMNGVVLLAVFALVTAPLMIAYGLDGYLAGLVVSLLAELVLRTIYLQRLFPGFNILRHSMRAILPSLPAVGLVLAARAAVGGDRTPTSAALEVAIYVVVTVAVTLVAERRLFRELIDYAKGSRQTGLFSEPKQEVTAG